MRAAMHDFFTVVGVLDRQIERRLVDLFRVQRPRLIRVGELRLQFDELGQVVVVERVRFPEVATGIELVVPDLSGGSTLLENSTTVFTPAP